MSRSLLSPASVPTCAVYTLWLSIWCRRSTSRWCAISCWVELLLSICLPVYGPPACRFVGSRLTLVLFNWVYESVCGMCWLLRFVFGEKVVHGLRCYPGCFWIVANSSSSYGGWNLSSLACCIKNSLERQTCYWIQYLIANIKFTYASSSSTDYRTCDKSQSYRSYSVIGPVEALFFGFLLLIDGSASLLTCDLSEVYVWLRKSD